MNARRILLAVILLSMAVFLVLHVERNARDPMINGKRLSVWIEEFDLWALPSASSVSILENSGALAEKLLIQMLRSRDSKLKLKLRELLSKQSLIKLEFASATFLQFQALNTCNLLGQRVQGTAPALTALVMDYPQKVIDSKTAFHALNTLAVMGTNGVQGIVKTLAHRDPALRIRAAELLGSMRAAGSEEAIQALHALSKDPDPGVAQTAEVSLELLRKRPTLSESATDALGSPEMPKERPVSVWDMAHGTRIISTSTLYPGCRPEDLFGARLSSVGTSEKGSAIFDDLAPDGFVHFIEWEIRSPVTVQSFGLIGGHETALNAFIRAFRGFRLYARPEGEQQYRLLCEENVPVPYGSGYCGTLLVRFRNLQTPVTARKFRVEFIQNGAGTYHGARAIELYGFDEQLSSSLITAALENQEPAIRDGVIRMLKSKP
jgi:hypothetical protein